MSTLIDVLAQHLGRDAVLCFPGEHETRLTYGALWHAARVRAVI